MGTIGKILERLATYKKEVAESLARDRHQILMRLPFIGSLLMRLELVPVCDPRLDTLATDGEHIFVDIDFYRHLDREERLFVLAHEAWHCALLHFVRRRGRDPVRFNWAADLEIHFLLTAEGFRAPSVLPHKESWKGLSAEEIYEDIPWRKGACDLQLLQAQCAREQACRGSRGNGQGDPSGAHRPEDRGNRSSGRGNSGRNGGKNNGSRAFSAGTGRGQRPFNGYGRPGGYDPSQGTPGEEVSGESDSSASCSPFDRGNGGLLGGNPQRDRNGAHGPRSSSAGTHRGQRPFNGNGRPGGYDPSQGKPGEEADGESDSPAACSPFDPGNGGLLGGNPQRDRNGAHGPRSSSAGTHRGQRPFNGNGRPGGYDPSQGTPGEEADVESDSPAACSPFDPGNGGLLGGNPQRDRNGAHGPRSSSSSGRCERRPWRKNDGQEERDPKRDKLWEEAGGEGDPFDRHLDSRSELEPLPGREEIPEDPDFSATVTEKKLEDLRAKVIAVIHMHQHFHGKLPGSYLSVIEPVLRPRLPWTEMLSQFVTSCYGGERRWLPPNRRYIGRGLYLQSTRRERLRAMVAIDTSGSTIQYLPRFFSELSSLLSTFGAYELTVIQCDAAVQRVDHYDDFMPLPPDTKWEMRGGGGTDFRPVFSYLEEHPEEAPTLLIYFTDGFGKYPSQPPFIPVLWLLTPDGKCHVDWGMVAVFDEEDSDSNTEIPGK